MPDFGRRRAVLHGPSAHLMRLVDMMLTFGTAGHFHFNYASQRGAPTPLVRVSARRAHGAANIAGMSVVSA